MANFKITFIDGTSKDIEADGYRDNSGWFRPATKVTFFKVLGSAGINMCHIEPVVSVMVCGIRSIE